MKYLAVIALALLSASAHAQGWSSAYDAPIIRALFKNDVRGCGEYRFKASDFQGEYIVQCTRDGHHWRTYKVWPGIQEVMRIKD